MNRKTILVIAALVVLVSLLAFTININLSLQKELRVFHNFNGYTMHLLSIQIFKSGHVLDLHELVAGNEAEYCEVIEGLWNPDTGECLGVSEAHCRLINGSMINEDKETNCIIG